MIKKLTGLTASFAALASIASASVKINDYLALDGYYVGSATKTYNSPGPDPDTTFDSGTNNLDSAKVGLTAKYEGFTGYVSMLWVPDMPAKDEAGILDAYLSYSVDKFTFTGGKFLSYLGYEAFHPIAMTQLTYGSTISAIPGYHSGVKADYAGEGFSAGAAVVDSIYGGPGFFEGDKEFSDDLGVEAYLTYTGVEKLTVFAGIASEDTDSTGDDVFVFNLWASYALSDKLTVAAEYVFDDTDSWSWLTFAQYAFTEKLSGIARISGIDNQGAVDSMKYTVSPTYVITENISVRAEVSYTDFASGDSATFYGVQGVFKF